MQKALLASMSFRANFVSATLSLFRQSLMLLIIILVCFVPTIYAVEGTDYSSLCVRDIDCALYDPPCDASGSTDISSESDGDITNDSSTPKNGQSLGGVAGTGFTEAEVAKAKTFAHGEFKGGGDFEATTYGPPWDSVEGTGVTSTGLSLAGPDNNHGRPRYVIAVDPAVIPYGSLVTVWPNAVKWRGAFLAADTGGAINGHHVDVYDWSGDATKDSYTANGADVKPYTGSPVETAANADIPGNSAACECTNDAGVGGPSDGGPLSGVHFPKLDDTAALANSINKYIKKGWPNSPLNGYGEKFVKYGQKYDVNPTIPVVISQVEYQFGTARTDLVGRGGPGQYNFWAVLHNSNAATKFGAYPSIDTAMEEHFKLLGGKSDSAKNGFSYIGPPQNFTTVSQIMKQYAPAFENDTPKYIQTILDGMGKLMNNAGVSGENGVTTSETNDTACTASSNSGNAVVNSEGYAFPIAAKKKSDYATFGDLSAVPCTNSAGCHHTESGPRGAYAFDLGVKGYGPDRSQNAPVYAISDGKIVHVTYQRNGGACNQIEFKSSKDGYVYWYGHLAADATIKAGQNYKAGQQIGKVGPSRCADNTAPHLHIDRGYPKGAMGGSPDARDQGIIPLINKLFSELPN